MRKLILLCLLLLTLLLPVTVGADPIPEDDRIGQTLVIEEDKTIFDEYVGTPSESEEPPQTLSLTEEYYLTTLVKPAALLFALGIAVFAAIKIVKKVNNTEPPDHHAFS